MKKRILFLCTGNSARSQMAEALAGLIAGDLFDAKSAGTHPAGLNPLTVQAMEDIGVDVRQARSKHVEEFLGQSFDYVITVCDRAKETCPIFPSAARLLHWSFEDPAAAPASERLTVFKHVRDEIADRLCRFVLDEKLLPPGRLHCYRCDRFGPSGAGGRSPGVQWKRRLLIRSEYYAAVFRSFVHLASITKRLMQL